MIQIPVRGLVLLPFVLVAACKSVRIDPAAAVQEAEREYESPEDSTFASRHQEFLNQKDWRLEKAVNARIHYVPNGGLNDRNGDFSKFDVDARIRMRQAIGPDTQIVYGGEFGLLHLDFDGPYPDGGMLYRLRGEIGVTHFFREDIVVEASFLPSAMTSFENGIETDDLFWNIEALGTWRQQPGLFFDAGFAISEEFGDTRFVPLLGARIAMDENWRFDVLLPRRIEASWRDSERTTLYGGFYREGADYHVEDTFLPGANEHDIHLSELRMAFGVDYQLTEDTTGWIEFGVFVGGEVEMRPGNVPSFEGGLESDPFLRVGFSWDL